MKKSIRTITGLFLAFSTSCVLCLTGCERKSDTERAVEKVGDKVEDAADEVGDAVEDATN